MLEYAYNSIKRYNPYNDLTMCRGTTNFFEQRFLEYLEDFRNNRVEVLKEKLGHQYDIELDNFFAKVIRKRNNQEISRILNGHLSLMNGEYDFDNEEAITDLKKIIRQVKDMILVSEPADMKRLQKIDEKVGEVIDKVSEYFNVSGNEDFNGIRISELFQYFNPSADLSLEEYSEYVASYRKIIDNICEHYRKNYSVDTATRYIQELRTVIDTFIRERNEKIDILSMDRQELIVLVNNSYLDWQRILVRLRSMNRMVKLSDYDVWVVDFKEKVDRYKSDIMKRYTDDVSKKFIEEVDLKTGELIDKVAKSVGYSKEYRNRLQTIFDSYKIEDLDIFDVNLYSSVEERDLAKKKYYTMSEEAKSVFEMRMYEQYIRIFKGKIREFNRSIRQTYSFRYASKLVSEVNRKADRLIKNMARKNNKPVPKNPWFIRKYLWSDVENFATQKGVNVRKFINPFMSNIIKVAMKNKLIIEERPQLDPTKEYIFVPTHYFTEDIIGLYASLGRQSYVLMGTTDQIENNFLMLAAIVLGLFYVDREDTVSRRECIDKQNRLIDYGSNFANYISGSWENSENELQPLSFSGPYRTSKIKNVPIVPVGLYLVREEKKIYVRYGEPLNLGNYDEVTANEIIRDTLASIHFKQMAKHSVPIDTIEIDGYGLTHNLPYNQHIYYMEQIANEYWNQYWSKPFAEEEIGVRPKKVDEEADVYSFVDNLSREKLLELSGILSEPLLRRYERDERYNIVKYIDENYDRLKSENSGSKSRIKIKKEN